MNSKIPADMVAIIIAGGMHFRITDWSCFRIEEFKLKWKHVKEKKNEN